jgi:tRNA 5-methylaminomethyl-2-thiouridine biosynthesis bifunctional protein
LALVAKTLTQPKHAQLDWIEGKPTSTQFDDIYFSKADGVAETHHVFIEGNDLTERLLNGEFAHQPLVIAETGFGTGSNLFCSLTWLIAHEAKAGKPLTPALHFITTELYPLSESDLAKALAALPHSEGFADDLIRQYPPLIPGVHRLSLWGGRCKLTLCIGDAAHAFDALPKETPVHAWFLDGFAPAKNPEMWSDCLFAAMARLSTPEVTQFSTFTAAGFVKRGLASVGFKIVKRNGFGQKRDMLTGVYTGVLSPSDALSPSDVPSASEDINESVLPKRRSKTDAPWFASPKAVTIPSVNTPKALVIGAGLAGCSSAQALASRGFKVDLVDAMPSLCAKASGNRQGALYAKLPTQPTLAGQFHLCGLEYSLRLLKQADLFDQICADDCGVLQLAHSDKEAERQSQMINEGGYDTKVVHSVSKEEASRLSGTQLNTGGLFQPRAAWVYPKAWCEQMIDHPNITLSLNTSVVSLNVKPDQENKDQWCAKLQSNDQVTEQTYSHVIIATAFDTKGFSQTDHFPLKSIRGQVSSVPVSDSLLADIKTVICAEGYSCPPKEGLFSFGATFNLKDTSDVVTEAEHDKNSALLGSASTTLVDALPPKDTWKGKVGFRCATPDYLPVAGPVPIVDAYEARYEALRRDRYAPVDESTPPYWPNLYVNVGHGSKGLITAPLCAELIAAQILGEPLPTDEATMHALHPARFLIRNLIRNQ